MSDFKYAVASNKPEDVLYNTRKALRDNNPMPALDIINEYYSDAHAQFHADSAIKLYKEKLNDK